MRRLPHLLFRKRRAYHEAVIKVAFHFYRAPEISQLLWIFPPTGLHLKCTIQFHIWVAGLKIRYVMSTAFTLFAACRRLSKPYTCTFGITRRLYVLANRRTADFYSSMKTSTQLTRSQKFAWFELAEREFASLRSQLIPKFTGGVGGVVLSAVRFVKIKIRRYGVI